jgi:hypothetical protein
VRVPRSARARAEVNKVRLHPSGSGRCRDGVDVHISREPVVWALDGAGSASCDLHVRRTYTGGLRPRLVSAGVARSLLGSIDPSSVPRARGSESTAVARGDELLGVREPLRRSLRADRSGTVRPGGPDMAGTRSERSRPAPSAGGSSMAFASSRRSRRWRAPWGSFR